MRLEPLQLVHRQDRYQAPSVRPLETLRRQPTHDRVRVDLRVIKIANTKSAVRGHYHNAYHNAERIGGGLWRSRRKWETEKPRKMGLSGGCRRRIRTFTN